MNLVEHINKLKTDLFNSYGETGAVVDLGVITTGPSITVVSVERLYIVGGRSRWTTTYTNRSNTGVDIYTYFSNLVPRLRVPSRTIYDYHIREHYLIIVLITF